jgi:DNA (cytosine-5)-methyltransferase 1
LFFPVIRFTFPKEFIFCGGISSQYKQVGNAVPSKLAEVFAKEIFKHLSNKQ